MRQPVAQANPLWGYERIIKRKHLAKAEQDIHLLLHNGNKQLNLSRDTASQPSPSAKRSVFTASDAKESSLFFQEGERSFTR